MPQVLPSQKSAATQTPPSPDLFFSTANAYQRTAALKGAIDLELFTAIGEGKRTAKDLAARCGGTERAVRILADYLVIAGFLTKDGASYGLTQDSAVFLDKKSPAYCGTAVDFLNSPMLMEHFRDIAGTVRKGGTLGATGGTVSHENPIWVEFARAMMPLTAMSADAVAKKILEGSTAPAKVLDIAGGHGLFGLAFAKHNPNAAVVLQDWASVAAVGTENAKAMGLADRFKVLPGSAFDVDFGTGYDYVLLTNFLHHFDAATNVKLLKKVHAALAPEGRAITVEFVPNDDRVSPAISAAFSLIMLASTDAGDAYTFRELGDMFKAAGFMRNDLHQLAPSPSQLVVSYK